MTKAMTEMAAIFEMSAGTPFFAEAAIRDFAKYSKGHSVAAAAIIRLRAIPLDCGRVVFPA